MQISLRIASLSAAALIAAGSPPARAADAGAHAVTLVEFSAEASRSAPNDLARATAFVEAGGADAAELARQVNAAIGAAIETAKRYPAVNTRSGTTSTYPIYAKNTSRIESWRMRSELLLESRDVPALSKLIGSLQASVGVTQIMLMPSPETRRRAEDGATTDAIAAFRAKAALIAASLGRSYRIRQLNIGGSARAPVVPLMRAAAPLPAAAAPIEPGDSSVTVHVSGQIELAGQ